MNHYYDFHQPTPPTTTAYDCPPDVVTPQTKVAEPSAIAIFAVAILAVVAAKMVRKC